MAELITYQNRRKMPAGTSGLPLSRWDIYDIVEPQKAAAELGENIANVSLDILEKRKREKKLIEEKFKQAKDLTDVNAGTTAMRTFMISMQDKYLVDPDYGTMLDRWDKETKTTRDKILKSNKTISGEARMELEQHLDSIILDFKDNITRISRNKQQEDGLDKFDAEIMSLLQTASLNADDPQWLEKHKEKINKEIDAAALAGYINDPLKRKAEVTKLLDQYNIDRLLNIDLSMAAEEVDKSKTLEPDEKNNYRDRIRTKQNQLIKKAEELLEIKREQDRDKLSDALVEGTLDYPMIESTSLKEKEQFTWYERYKNSIKETETDGEIYDSLDDEIMTFHKGTGNRNTILEKLRKSRFDDLTLSETDYRNLKKRLDSDVLKDPSSARLFTALNDLKTAHAILDVKEIKALEETGNYAEDFEKAETAKWINLTNKLEKWLEDNPKSTLKEKEEFFTSLTKQEKHEIKKSLASRIWSGYLGLSGPALIYKTMKPIVEKTETRKPIRPNIEYRKFQDWWKSSPLENQKKIREALNNGWTWKQIWDAQNASSKP